MKRIFPRRRPRLRQAATALAAATQLVAAVATCPAQTPLPQADPVPSVPTPAAPVATRPLPGVAPAVPNGATRLGTQLNLQPETRDWWRSDVLSPLRPAAQQTYLTLDEALIRTLAHSPQVRVFSDLPHIRRTAIAEAAAAWDWNAFVEARWDDVYEPVGNTLTTGGSDRFSDHNVGGSAGVRRRTQTGGSIELSERMGWQDTNSDFFIPGQQGTSRLSLSFTQPLLRGRGVCYNRSLLVLAEVDAGVADHEFSRQLQAHLVEVVRAYWGLYLERASLVQRQASGQRAATLRDGLKLRTGLDAVLAQIERADAEVAVRDAERLRAEMAVANSESRLRALIGDPSLGLTDCVELIPADQPAHAAVPLDMAAARAAAVAKRPEVLQAIAQIRAASIRLGMARHELLPTLNLLTELYVSGLEGDGNVGRALSSQLDEGAPSYSIGLAYEVPIGRRAAQARCVRKRLELRQLQNQYRTTLDTLGLEVEAAVREVTTASAEVSARRRQFRASQTQLDYLTKRWQLLPNEGTTSSLVMENLLDAQDRLADAEFALVSAEVTRDLAMVNVRRATGELLAIEAVGVGQGCRDGLPTTFVSKRPTRDAAPIGAPLPIGAAAALPERPLPTPSADWLPPRSSTVRVPSAPSPSVPRQDDAAPIGSAVILPSDDDASNLDQPLDLYFPPAKPPVRETRRETGEPISSHRPKRSDAVWDLSSQPAADGSVRRWR